MFTVLGLTGQTGAATAEALLALGQTVRAPLRDPARAGAWAARGVALVPGEATDVAAMTEAFRGVNGAFVLVPPNPAHPDPIAWYITVAAALRQAARAAALPRLVLLSSEGAHLPLGTGPVRGLHIAEAILADAAPVVSVLRAGYFQENWRDGFGLAQAQGILPTMLTDADRPRTMLAAADIGTAAAGLLTAATPAPILELAGPADPSAQQAAEMAAAVLGRPVALAQPPRAAWNGILESAGIGPAYAGLLVELMEGINAGHVRFSGSVPLTRGTTGLEATMRAWTEK